MYNHCYQEAGQSNNLNEFQNLSGKKACALAWMFFFGSYWALCQSPWWIVKASPKCIIHNKKSMQKILSQFAESGITIYGYHVYTF